MQLHLDLSEDIAQALTAGGGDLDLAARQSIALEGYRSGRLPKNRYVGYWASNRAWKFMHF